MTDDSPEIRDRKRLEEALRVAEERFRTLVQFSFDVYWETDARHRFVRQDFANALADAPRAGSEIGKTRWEVPYLEPDEEAWRKHRAMLDAHLPFRDFELARPTPDGGRRYVSVSGFPVFDATGRFVGYRGVGRHITERKRAEAEHRAYVRFLECMDRINGVIRRSDDLERTVGDVLDTVLDIFDCDRAWLLQPCDAQARSWRAVMERTRPGCAAAFAGQTELPTDPALGAQVAITLEAKGGAPYLFGAHYRSGGRSWTDDEQHLFEAIGGRLADALATLLMFRNLRESERRLEARQELLDLAQKAANAVAFDWHIGERESENRWSPELEAMYGLEPGAFDGTQRSWKKLVHADDWPAVKAALGRAHESGDVAAEYRVVHGDGTVHWLRAKGRMFFDARRQPERMVGFMFDVTDWRHAEQALRESEARFRKLTDLSADWYWRQDENLRFTLAADEKIGYSAPISIGKTRWELPVTPISGSWEEHRAVLAARQPFRDFQYSRIDPDGGTRYISVSGMPVFDERGEFKGYDGVASDITPRKRAEQALRESEARFRSFVDHATDAFFLLDEQLIVVDVNRQACQNLGWSREELIGKHPRDFDAALDERSIASLAERARAGETITFETRHRRKDGTAFPVEIRTRMFGQDKERFYLALARDITERKLAEETVRDKDHALHMARAELARVSRVTTLGELTASIAHEVNQPLAAMIANAAACARWLAARPPDPGKARQALESIAADGKRAGEIIGRIRSLTKAVPPRKVRLDVNRKILDVLALTEEELRNRHVALETRLERDLPPVSGDRVQLQQVLLNLIVNAMDAMDAVHDRPRVVTIVSKREGEGAVTVEVRDSGTGLDAAAAERLFEAFYTTKPEGIGIVLSISRSIIEAHGGRLWAAANAPHGAVFRFSLPVAEDERG